MNDCIIIYEIIEKVVALKDYQKKKVVALKTSKDSDK